MIVCAARKYMSSADCVSRFAPDAIKIHDFGMSLNREKIGAALRQLRKSKRMTLEDVAIRAEFDAGNLSRVERGLQGVADETLFAIATALNARVSDIYALAEGPSTKEPHGDYVTLEPGPDLPPYHRTPVVGLAQLGPDGYYDAIEYPVGFGDGYLDVPTRDPNAYALKVRGDSMFPAIRDGWYVVIEPNRDHHPGDFVMVKTFDGRCMIKELLHERNGEIVLGNVNGNYGRLTLEREQVEKISLVGGIYPPSKYQPDGGA